ncbi:uncharacterized protein [Littorina saxatilis]|uniref:Tryptophan-rich sensory protein n=1 Tax=Littorina saxatilis TaxID=31220 RepID=A0AAN9ATP4_9CAEN
MAKEHNGWYIALVVFNVITLIAVYVINGLSGSGPGYGLFVSSQSEQADKYKLEITPAGWTFSIWGVIYVWQALWVLYSIVNLFRKNCNGHPVYSSPFTLPPLLFGFYAVANGCNIAWIFLFDRSHVEAAFAVLLLNALLLILALAVSYKRLDATAEELVTQSRGFDVWLVRGFVQNGLGVYCTWTTIATLLNLAMVIAYTKGSNISAAAASTVALGVLSFLIALFVLADLLFLDRYSRYTVTPYLVVIVALVGSLTNNWDSEKVNSIFTAVLLGVGGVALLAKVILTVYRHFRDRRSLNMNI